jgi:DNA-binding CsgD family transcriptional regulator
MIGVRDPSTPVARRPPLLVGRERERATLRDLLGEALAGRGGIALIGGEAGIGKTALAEEAAREATARGALVLVGRCYDLAETPPYGPWLDLFAGAPRAPELPPLPLATMAGGESSGASQTALFGQVRAFLAAAAARQPLLLVLDDLHWADPASLDLLRVVARDLAHTPILILAIYRTEELTRQHPFFALLPHLVREAGAIRLDLRTLGDDAIRALLRARYALAGPDEARLLNYLQARAEGNPFFAGELLRALEEVGALRKVSGGWTLGDLTETGVPPLLRQVIEGRLARLGENARDLLTVAAVIGQVVPLSLWATTGGIGEEALLDVVEHAVTAHILFADSDGVRVRFVHALTREALYEGLLPSRRRGWHRRVAEALLAAPDPDPDVVANHLRRAGDRRAFEWLLRAGLRARRAAAWVSAGERCAEGAAVLAEEGGHERERGWLLFYCGRMRFFSDTAQALRHFDEAESLALAAREGALTAFIRISRSITRCLRADIRRGLAEMERAVAALERVPGRYHLLSGDQAATAMLEALLPEGTGARRSPRSDPPAITNHRINLFHWLSQAGRYRDALAMGLPLTAILRSGAVEDDQPNLGSAHLGLGNAYAALGRPSDARREHACALAAHRASRDTFMAGYTVWIDLLLVHIPYQADDLAARARAAAEGARIWSQAAGTTTTATHGAQSDLPLALLEGRWADARRLAQDGHDSAIVGYFLGARVALALLDRWQGHPALAWEQVRALHPDGPDTQPGDTYFPHGMAALALAANLALEAGDPGLAGRWIAAHGRWLEWSGAVLWQADHLILQSRHARASGDPAGARGHADAALARATEPRQPLALLAAHRLLGELDTAAGDYATAGDHLTQALALAEACAAPYERALALLALAELRAAHGDGLAAGNALAEARAVLAPLEARPALARCDSLAARLGGIAGSSEPSHRARSTAPILTAGLTAREVEVLRLVAGGRSNREAAAELAVSERTVERHLENLYRKIAARNRADAVAYALRRGLA